MSYASAPPSAPRLDIADHVGRAYRTLVDNLQPAVELALIPYVIVLAAQLLAYGMSGGHHMAMMLAALIFTAASLLAGAIFAVRWLRLILLDERVGGSLVPPGWTGFVVAAVKLGAMLFVGWIVLVFLAVVPPLFLTLVLSAAGIVAMALLAARVLLIFPAAAIERPLSFAAAWALLQGNFWRFFLCLVLCHLPFLVVGMVIASLAVDGGWLLAIIGQAIHLAVMYAGSAVALALLAQVYREFAAP